MYLRHRLASRNPVCRFPSCPAYAGMTAVNNRYNNSTQIKEPGYLERTSVLYFVGAASSRDRFNSRLEAAPTGVFFSYLDLPDKRKILLKFLIPPPLAVGWLIDRFGRAFRSRLGLRRALSAVYRISVSIFSNWMPFLGHASVKCCQILSNTVKDCNIL